MIAFCPAPHDLKHTQIHTLKLTLTLINLNPNFHQRGLDLVGFTPCYKVKPLPSYANEMLHNTIIICKKRRIWSNNFKLETDLGKIPGYSALLKQEQCSISKMSVFLFNCEKTITKNQTRKDNNAHPAAPVHQYVWESQCGWGSADPQWSGNSKM